MKFEDLTKEEQAKVKKNSVIFWAYMKSATKECHRMACGSIDVTPYDFFLWLSSEREILEKENNDQYIIINCKLIK